MTRPGDHNPATPRQEHIMRTDAQLSALIQQAIKDRDMHTITDAMAEKVDLERALDKSRHLTWNEWHYTNTSEGDAA